MREAYALKHTHSDFLVFGTVARVERVPRRGLVERERQNRWHERNWRVRHVVGEGRGGGEGGGKRKERAAVVGGDAAVEGNRVLRARLRAGGRQYQLSLSKEERDEPAGQ